jgi:hypothetical protein
MSRADHSDFPVGGAFLTLTQGIADAAGDIADEFIIGGGAVLPRTAEKLGTSLSLMYRAAACGWGCDGGDHAIEWLAGRAVNQATAAFRLARAASYDESLNEVRSVGETANLLWLFQRKRAEIERWKTCTRKERLQEFGPSAVRKKLEILLGETIPISAERYQALCEVATHPVPGVRPDHYVGLGVPVLGGVLQEAGLMTAINELAYAVSMCTIPLAALLELPGDVKDDLMLQGRDLLKGIGSFNVLSFEDLLAEHHARQPQGK